MSLPATARKKFTELDPIQLKSERHSVVEVIHRSSISNARSPLIFGRSPLIPTPSPISVRSTLFDHNAEQTATLKLSKYITEDPVKQTIGRSSGLPRKKVPLLSLPQSKFKRNSSHPLLDIVAEPSSPSPFNKDSPSPQLSPQLEDSKKKMLLDAPLLLVSKEALTQRNASKPFLSFKEVLSAKREKSKELDLELKAPRTSRNYISTQLMLNKMSERIYESSIQAIEKESQTKIISAWQSQKIKERQMPPVKKYPSRSLNSSIYNDTRAELFLQPKVEKSQTTIKSVTDDVRVLSERSMSVFIYKGPEVLCDRPEVREGAAMVAVGNFAYVYGGNSKSLLNDIDIFDISNKYHDLFA